VLSMKTKICFGKIHSSSVKGCLKNVIVVRHPPPPFQQAIFILDDKYMYTPGISKKVLLEQARKCASEYMKSPDN